MRWKRCARFNPAKIFGPRQSADVPARAVVGVVHFVIGLGASVALLTNHRHAPACMNACDGKTRFQNRSTVNPATPGSIRLKRVFF